jgi:hypothetical protein
MYQEQCNQARQHENLRQQSTTIILTLTGAILAAVVASAGWVVSGLYDADLTLWFFASYSAFGAFVIALGLFGRRLSLKHYERNRMHSIRAGAYRREIEKLLAAEQPNLGGKLRDEAMKEHRREWSKEGRDPRLVDERLYAGWLRIYAFIVTTGVFLAIGPIIVAAVGSQFLQP